MRHFWTCYTDYMIRKNNHPYIEKEVDIMKDIICSLLNNIGNFVGKIMKYVFIIILILVAILVINATGLFYMIMH